MRAVSGNIRQHFDSLWITQRNGLAIPFCGFFQILFHMQSMLMEKPNQNHALVKALFGSAEVAFVGSFCIGLYAVTVMIADA